MIVKSITTDSHLIAEIFQVLKKYNMHLNPTKCAFGVSSIFFLIHYSLERNICKSRKDQYHIGDVSIVIDEGSITINRINNDT